MAPLAYRHIIVWLSNVFDEDADIRTFLEELVPHTSLSSSRVEGSRILCLSGWKATGPLLEILVKAESPLSC